MKDIEMEMRTYEQIEMELLDKIKIVKENFIHSKTSEKNIYEIMHMIEELQR